MPPRRRKAARRIGTQRGGRARARGRWGGGTVRPACAHPRRRAEHGGAPPRVSKLARSRVCDTLASLLPSACVARRQRGVCVWRRRGRTLPCRHHHHHHHHHSRRRHYHHHHHHHHHHSRRRRRHPLPPPPPPAPDSTCPPPRWRQAAVAATAGTRKARKEAVQGGGLAADAKAVLCLSYALVTL